MIGLKFGNLTIQEEVLSDVKGHRKFKCLCDCGEYHIVIYNNLKKGNTRYCKKCASMSRSISQTTHNVKKNRGSYNTYVSMLDRCNNHKRYLHVKICDRWLGGLQGFLNFLEDMGDRPVGTTLDRIDNSLGYFKENCRWATVGVQNHNKSKRRDSKTSKYIGVSICPKSKMYVVQIMIDGKRTMSHFKIEEDAAVEYDNISEQFYGDRPNKTQYRVVFKNQRKTGGYSFDKKTGKFRVRVTLDGERISLGFYMTEQEATNALEHFLLK